MRLRFRVAGLCSIGVSVAACLAGCGEEVVFQPPPPPEVTVQPPAYEDVTVFREFSGRLEAESTVDVRARVQGFLRSVEFVDGETVRGPSDGEPGQVLFTIEPEH